MKKYTFRLERVRSVRQTQEHVAKATVQAANADVQRAAQAVIARQLAYEQVTTRSAGMTDYAVFAKERHFAQLSLQAVLAAQAEHRAAQERAAEKIALLAEAAMKVKTLDRLDERAREEYDVEAARAADREIDDMVTSRFAEAEGAK